jgi:large-conductance mechanosensitive channel
MLDIIDRPKTKGTLDWLATVFYPLAVVLMEACWVYPWLVWLGSWPAFDESRPVLRLASVIITLAVSLLVTRIALRQKWGLWRIRSVIIGGGLVVILLVLGVDYQNGYAFLSGGWFGYIWQTLGTTFINTQTIVLAIPVLLYLWWRGIILGQTTSYFRDIYRTFMLGMAALIILIIFWQISSASERFTKPGADIGWYVIAFFFFGLISIAICHLYLMRRAMPREEARLTSVWRWLPVMLGVIGGVVLVGFGVASIFSPALFESIGHGFSAAGDFLGTIMGYILTPIIFVFEWLVKIFIYFINLLRGDQAQPPGATGNMTAPEQPEIIPKELPPWVTEAIKWFVVALIVGLVLFILVKAVSRMRTRRARDEIEEIHESLWSWKGLRDDLRELLGMLGDRFKRKPAAPGYRFDEDAAGRMDIREIYRHVLWEGARSGIPRRRHETASEYSGRLHQSVPESEEPLKNITDEYENVRYGEMNVPEERVDSANSLWGKLRALLRKLREGT